jgi:3-phosphoshikimate 1-carboxyvinyltransferase
METPPAIWPAPQATDPVRAQVRLPGSKSMTNRALVLAALAAGPAEVQHPLRARDTQLMAAALRALGAQLDTADPVAWRVTPGWASQDTRVEVGNAGTVLRFVPPVAALASVAVEFHGDPAAARRPVGGIIAALRDLGAVIDDGGRGAVPFTVHGTGSLPGGVVTVDASASSQLVSGLLLAAPRYEKGLEVRHRGSRAPSAPHIAMTVQMLRDAGATVETSTMETSTAETGGGPPDTWFVHPGPLGSQAVRVQPDVVNSAPFLAAALVTGGSVTILDWPSVTSQPASQILDVFTQLGATCTIGPDGLTVTGTGRIHGITADLADCNEISMVTGALAALADAPSVLTGIGHQRTHETDRLAALATEINALGGAVTELADGLRIEPRPLRAAARPLRTYDDHRLVMAAAVLGLAVPGLAVADPATVGKTFPEFPDVWAAMLEQAP